MKEGIKRFFKGLAMVAGAGALAALLVWLVIWGDAKYRLYLMSKESEAVRNAEYNLMDLENNVAARNNVEVAMGRLNAMNEDILSNDQMRRRLLLLGDINLLYYKTDTDNPQRKSYFDLATRFYERAAEYCKSPGMESERNEIIRRIAGLYVDNKEWQKALLLIAQSVSLQMLPEDRWKLKMLEAECLRNTGRPYQAMRKFLSVADESDDKKLWSEALVMKADMLVDAATDPEMLKAFLTKDGLLRAESQAAGFKIDEAAERAKLLKEAFADYQSLLAKLPATDPQAGRAMLGMMRIYVVNGDKRGAYEMANAIRISSLTMRDKAESLVLLADLHENMKEYKTAISILESCVANYPLSSMFVPVSMKLYRYYKKAEEWDKAFNVAERLLLRGPDTDTIVTLISDFTPDKSEMLKNIGLSEQRDRYIKRLRDILDGIMTSHPEAWRQVRHQAEFIYASLLYMTGQYDQAERVIAAVFHMPLLPRPLEDELLFLDLNSALKSGKSPAVVVARAKRYLDGFPSGRHYQDALIALLDAYCKMEMFEVALEISKRIYVDDLMKKEAKVGNPYWLRTVAKIGECYQRLGKFDKANTILRENADALIDMPEPADVFMAWSDVALERGQIYEALRRLDVVIPKTVDVFKKADLIVARYLLQLKVGGSRDYRLARELLSQIEGSKKLPEGQKLRLRRELYKGLLEYAFRTKSPDIPELVSEVINGFSNESWPQYWVLLSLSELYGSGELDALGRKHEDALKSELASKAKDSEALSFIEKQLKLIKALVSIEEDAKKLKTERGL